MKPLTLNEQQQLNQALLRKLKWRLLDKSGPQLPPEGKYYFEINPHHRAMLGALAHSPSPEDLERPYPPAPNSIGLCFLVSPDIQGTLELSVSGRFDLEYAYIPDFSDMLTKLVRDEAGEPRRQQTVPDAFRRYTVTFEASQFHLNLATLPATAITPSQDTVRQALADHLAQVRADPRIYRTLHLQKGRPRRQQPIPWDMSSEMDQARFTEEVINALFVPGTGPLNYDLRLELRIRPAPAALAEGAKQASYLVEVYLVNYTSREVAANHGLSDHRVMDPYLAIQLRKGQHQRMRFTLAPPDYRYREQDRIDGYGLNCALLRTTDGTLYTESLPSYAQPLRETVRAAERGINAEPEFHLLATAPLPLLEDLLIAMDRYAADWRAEIEALAADDPTHPYRDADHQAFVAERHQIADGIAALRTDPLLRRAFMLMNEALAAATERQGKTFTSWRLFQLAFILSQLGAVRERFQSTGQSETLDCREYADVLWFPTGGGKTEAYFGLITLALFYQRLNRRLYGCSAWLRFPLRMLSVQQFQRLAYVIGQANRIKAREQIPGHPFTLGYFTGTGTPGILSDRLYKAGDYLPYLAARPERLEALRFINHCPYCGANVQIETDIERFRLKHVCTNPDCWSNTTAPLGEYGEGIRGELGLYVSDEEVYRYLPSVLVGTLDKLAVLGHNVRFSRLLGDIRFYCPDHGFSREGRCEHKTVQRQGNGWGEPQQCPNNSQTSAVRTIRLPAFLDPGFPLIINDEAHLLKEDLGNFSSHYETVLAHLQEQAGGLPPKILGATATIRDFEHQFHHLYLRHGRRFPSPDRSLYEGFYTRTLTEPVTGEPLTRRIFAGMLPSGTRPDRVTEAIGDANQLYLLLLDELEHNLGDPAMQTTTTAALGFPAERAAALTHHLRHCLRPTLIYVNRTADADRIVRRIEDEPRAGAGDCVRLDGQTPLSHIQEAIERIEQDDPANPVDQLVATRVVSHGVDIARLNMALFAGWPPSTAEYLQASSRSGRVYVGLVVISLDYIKRYEHTIFSHFRDYQAFLDRLVEAVPINRFAPNVLPRTLPGAFQALVLHWARRQPWGAKINTFAQPLYRALNAEPAAREQLVQALTAAFQFEQAQRLNVFHHDQVAEAWRETERRARRLVNLFYRLEARFEKDSIATVLARRYEYAPMRSFRDIEGMIEVKPASSDYTQLLDALS